MYAGLLERARAEYDAAVSAMKDAMRQQAAARARQAEAHLAAAERAAQVMVEIASTIRSVAVAQPARIDRWNGMLPEDA
jgi:hypothetical protein